ncbi:MAG TPA: SRPBCC domain-containing protein [Acidimicrobiales bacterium]|nr:SRPBCC domain-containing protein [Acidimicrobiales bacterium]
MGLHHETRNLRLHHETEGDSMTGPAPIRRRLTVPAAHDRVWGAITDPGQMQGWFGGEMDWSLEPGAPLSYRGDDGELRHGRVEEIRPGRRLRFVWWPVDDNGHPLGLDGEATEATEVTEVTYLVEPVPDGTALTIQEKPMGAGAPQARASAAQRRAGWDDWDSRLAGAWVNLSAGTRTGARA